MFASYDEHHYKEIAELLTLDNFRQHKQLSGCGDIYSECRLMLVELKKVRSKSSVSLQARVTASIMILDLFTMRCLLLNYDS